jgi:hypothetical protein
MVEKSVLHDEGLTLKISWPPKDGHLDTLEAESDVQVSNKIEVRASMLPSRESLILYFESKKFGEVQVLDIKISSDEPNMATVVFKNPSGLFSVGVNM